jgi:hypothetical protein
VRSAAEINLEIRELWQQCSGRLGVHERARYERLVVDWAAAKTREAKDPGHDENPLHGHEDRAGGVSLA